MSVPTLIFQRGQPVQQMIGIQAKADLSVAEALMAWPDVIIVGGAGWVNRRFIPPDVTYGRWLFQDLGGCRYHYHDWNYLALGNRWFELTTLQDQAVSYGEFVGDVHHCAESNRTYRV